MFTTLDSALLRGELEPYAHLDYKSMKPHLGAEVNVFLGHSHS